jgi:6-phospho-beta-glucosidase
VARYLAVPPDAVSLTYVGLNHLGWVTDVTVGGHSRLAYLLDHYQDMSRDDAEFAAFDADLVRSLGMLPNEYLYYYYYAADAVKNLRQAGETRGEQVAALSQRLFQRLGEAARQNDWQAAWTAYASIMGTRSQTYMQRDMHGTQANRSDRPAVVQEDAGYAGVAIRVASGMASGWSRPVIVNVANRQAVADLEPTDVVEISAVLGADGAHPLAFGALPPKIRGLMLQVKEYERLTIQAAVQGDRQLAVEALAANPLVPSYTVARQMVEQYLKELKPWLPQFA